MTSKENNMETCDQPLHSASLEEINEVNHASLLCVATPQKPPSGFGGGFGGFLVAFLVQHPSGHF